MGPQPLIRWLEHFCNLLAKRKVTLTKKFKKKYIFNTKKNIYPKKVVFVYSKKQLY